MSTPRKVPIKGTPEYKRMRELNRKALRRMHDKYPEKWSARAKSYRAMKSGQVLRLPCCICGKPEVHAHHEDYSKPLLLVWLCHRHHVDRHKGLITIGELEVHDYSWRELPEMKSFPKNKSANKTNKLTAEMVLEIRRVLAMNIMGYSKKLADKFGVDPKTIELIKYRKTWKKI